MKCPLKFGKEDESCDHECAWLTWPFAHGEKSLCAITIAAIRRLDFGSNTENVNVGWS